MAAVAASPQAPRCRRRPVAIATLRDLARYGCPRSSRWAAVLAMGAFKLPPDTPAPRAGAPAGRPAGRSSGPSPARSPRRFALRGRGRGVNASPSSNVSGDKHNGGTRGAGACRPWQERVPALDDRRHKVPRYGRGVPAGDRRASRPGAGRTTFTCRAWPSPWRPSRGTGPQGPFVLKS